MVDGTGSGLAARWTQVLASWPPTTANRRKFNDLHHWYPKVHESVRHSMAKTLRPLFGTHFRSRQSSPVSRVATDLDIRDRVSMQTGRLSQVPNCPIERSTRYSNLCICHRQETSPVHHIAESMGGSNELQII
jgi:hypothetical protein